MRDAMPLREVILPRFLFLTSGLGTLTVTLVAAPPVKAARMMPELTDGQKREALQAVQPGIADAEATLRLQRLEVAWTRAKALGLLGSSEWRTQVEEGRRAILLKAFLDSQPGHPGLTEAQIKASFLAQPEQRRVSHILCRTAGEAEEVLKRLQAGEPFDKVATEVSKDPSAAVNKGELGWIRQEQMVKAFGEPVFKAAIGALVGPLQSEYGWHVAKAWEARRPTEAEFPAQREALLKEAATAQENMKREALLGDLRRRFPLKADMAVLNADRTTEVAPGDERKVAGRVAGSSISLKALKTHLAETLKTVGASHSLGAATKARFMEGLADELRLAAAAKAQGFDQRPAVRGALWLDQRERAFKRFAEEYLAALKVPEAELQRHHAAHEDRFRRVGALRLQVLVADSQNSVEEALNAVRFGLPWREAVTRFGSSEATGNPEPGWVEVTDLQKLVPASLLQPMLGGRLRQPVGPMLGPDGFMIFNVLERRPGPVLPLEGCRDEVRADYLKVNGEALVARELDRPS